MIDVRTGLGYDVHRFQDGDHIWLGGVKLAHTRGMDAHSDGDVALHALTDAILGAIGEGDIGDHFPPSDPKWKNARSDQFVIFAREFAEKKNYTLSNVDITIIAENPKIGPHRSAILNEIAKMLQISPDRCSIKATTNEKMGFVGRDEGIAAMAVATVIGKEK